MTSARARIKGSWLKRLAYRIRVHDPDEYDIEVQTDSVGNLYLCAKVKEDMTYDVFVLDRENAEGLMAEILRTADASGWDIARRR